MRILPCWYKIDPVVVIIGQFRYSRLATKSSRGSVNWASTASCSKPQGVFCLRNLTVLAFEDDTTSLAIFLIFIFLEDCHNASAAWFRLSMSFYDISNIDMFALFRPSVLWHCWLGGRKGIRSVKNRVVGCWCGCLSGARCRLAYGPADSTATHRLLLQ